MRGSILLVAVAVAFSTGAIAADDAVQPASANSTALKLSDAELDQITAGAFLLVIFNPGKHVVMPVDGADRFFCMNCLPGVHAQFGTGGAIQNAGNPEPRLLGSWRSLANP